MNRLLLRGCSLALCLYLDAIAGAQQGAQGTAAASPVGKPAQGTLTVTATVVSSVGIVIGPNGEQVLVVANAPSSGDNMVALTAVQTPAPPSAGSQRNTNKTTQKPPALQ